MTAATTVRVLRQLRRDHRTLAMLILLPAALLGLMRWIYDDSPGLFAHVGPALLGILPFVVMFLVTSVAMLRERTSGTLERLLTTPMHKLDLLLGYGAAFGLVAIVQAALATSLMVTVYGLDVGRGGWALGITATTVALLGNGTGLLMSAFARTEFQAVQFLPAVVIPQFLLCGLLVPRDQLAQPLQAVSDALPLSYAVDAMAESYARDGLTTGIGGDLAVVGGCALLAIALAAGTLRRRSA